MRKLSVLASILAFAASGAAFAQQASQADRTSVQKAVPMTEAQMDKVTAGALLDVALVDVVDIGDVNVQVAVPVNASVAVGVLGGALSTGLQAPGRVLNRQ
jgi:hypothetical protein